MTHRRAFTLIELLLVLTVILILTALSIGHFGQSMRKSAVQEAAQQILRASDLARQLGLQGTGTGATMYGVRLEATSDGQTSVSVLQSQSGRSSLAEGPDGEPLLEYRFPSSAVLWEGSRDLSSGSGTLEWWFAPSTGEVVELAGGATQQRYVGVGTRPVTTEALWGLASNALTSPVIAPANALDPGLSVRTPDNRYRIALGVYPSGLAYSTTYQDYEGNR
jgi:prepilin-type N-terminal cleavage/methylation domain-containing protein